MSHLPLEILRSKTEELEVVEKVLGIKLAETIGVGDEVITLNGEVKKLPHRGQTHLSRLRNEHFLSIGMNYAITNSSKLSEQFTSSKRMKIQIEATKANGLQGFLQDYKNLKTKKKTSKNFITTGEDMKQELGDVTDLNILLCTKMLNSKVKNALNFSGEEFHGRCLDLHSFHHRFINLMSSLPKYSQVQYMDYIDKIALFSSYEYSKVKVKKEYCQYLEDLAAYLRSFQLKTQPLVDIDIKQTIIDLQLKYSRGNLRGWKTKYPEDNLVLKQSLDTLSDKEVRACLVYRGLKVGGTAANRCNRLKKAVASGPIDTQIVIFGETLSTNLYSNNIRSNKTFISEKVAILEGLISFLIEKLQDAIEKTREKITKKATQSYREIKAEEELLEKAEQELVYNEDKSDIQPVAVTGTSKMKPSNLPIGKDGNPIPRWLYKMNGMNFEFKCEICGNESYQGRVNFERHFQESRHVSGMKLLGIPNTKHFQGTTKIADARELYIKLQRQVNNDFAIEEEFETPDGRKVVHRQNISFV